MGQELTLDSTRDKYLIIANNTNINIVDIKVEDVGDGFESSNPNKFANNSIGAKTSFKNRLECVLDQLLIKDYNRGYKMILKFADDYEIGFSTNDQLGGTFRVHSSYSGSGKYAIEFNFEGKNTTVSINPDTHAEYIGKRGRKKLNV